MGPAPKQELMAAPAPSPLCVRGGFATRRQPEPGGPLGSSSAGNTHKGPEPVPTAPALPPTRKGKRTPGGSSTQGARWCPLTNTHGSQALWGGSGLGAERWEATVWMGDFCGSSEWDRRQAEVPEELAAQGSCQGGRGPLRQPRIVCKPHCQPWGQETLPQKPRPVPRQQLGGGVGRGRGLSSCRRILHPPPTST